MPGTLTITGRTVGQRRPLFADWSIPYPPELRGGGDELTLRDVITRVVTGEVEAFRQRQEDRKTVRALTARQIADGAARGKIDMGGRDLQQAVDLDSSIAAALQAFEDGLYLVLVDDIQHDNLDRPVRLQPDSRITFLRLTMLAGG